MSRSTAVLLLNCRRPEFTRERLKEIAPATSEKFHLISSVDGTPPYYEGENKNAFNVLREEFPGIQWQIESKNLGLAKHLFLRVSESLQTYDNVIVIEDDISISATAIEQLINILNNKLEPSILTVGLFGPIPRFLPSQIIANRWRRTKYFSAWGWAIQREAWNTFDLSIVRKMGLNALESSHTWKKLTDHQKTRWNYRFNKVLLNPYLTWDYQMQFLSFINNLVHVLPLFRLCDNLGFNDMRATNTKSIRPRWYIGSKAEETKEFKNKIPNKFENILEKVDSFTWIGDKNYRDFRNS